jgi:hypothetical protein
MDVELSPLTSLSSLSEEENEKVGNEKEGLFYSMADFFTQWCAGCCNGGTLFECDRCKRVVCDECMEVPDFIRNNIQDMIFTCPACHLVADNARCKDAGRNVR